MIPARLAEDGPRLHSDGCCKGSLGFFLSVARGGSEGAIGSGSDSFGG